MTNPKVIVLFGVLVLVLALLVGCNCGSNESGEVNRERWSIPESATNVVDLGNYWFCFEVSGESFIFYRRGEVFQPIKSCPIRERSNEKLVNNLPK